MWWNTPCETDSKKTSGRYPSTTYPRHTDSCGMDPGATSVSVINVEDSQDHGGTADPSDMDLVNIVAHQEDGPPNNVPILLKRNMYHVPSDATSTVQKM